MVVLLLLAALAQDPEPPKEPDFSIDVLGWYALPGGWVSITRGSRAGTATRMDLDGDADLESEVVPEVEARWEFLDAHSVGVRGALMDLSGTGVTDEGFIYRGVAFGAGRTIHTELDFVLLQVDYRYTALRTDDVSLSARLGAEYWKYSARVRTADAGPPLDTQRAFDSAFWMLGIDIDWPALATLDLQLRIAGGMERSEQYFYDVDARVQWNPWAALGFSLGYRYQALRFRQSTNASDLSFQGPEIGLELRF